MSGLRCALMGHLWASFDVTWHTPQGDPQVAMNHRCARCGEPRNPYIFADQELRLKHDGTAVLRGDWVNR